MPGAAPATGVSATGALPGTANMQRIASPDIARISRLALCEYTQTWSEAYNAKQGGYSLEL